MPKTTPREEAALKKLDANPNAPRYVSCDLNKAQKEALVAFIADTDDEALWKWVDFAVVSNHSISLKAIEVGYQCSVTGQARHATHGNVCLISRASTPIKALWSCFYKDTEVLGGIWPVSNRMEELDV